MTIPSGPAEQSPRLGRVALWLGLATLVCAAISGIGWMILDDRWSAVPILAVALGIATVVAGVVGIVRRSGRRQAIIGLALAAASPLAGWLVAFVTFLVAFEVSGAP